MLNRTACDIIEEARACCKTLNFSYLKGLLEELQSCCNRMEAKLENAKDIEWEHKEIKRLKELKRGLKEEVNEKERKWEEM